MPIVPPSRRTLTTLVISNKQSSTLCCFQWHRSCNHHLLSTLVLRCDILRLRRPLTPPACLSSIFDLESSYQFTSGPSFRFDVVNHLLISYPLVCLPGAHVSRRLVQKKNCSRFARRRKRIILDSSNCDQFQHLPAVPAWAASCNILNRCSWKSPWHLLHLV